MKDLMRRPHAWLDADVIWFHICDHEHYSKKNKAKAPEYPFSWLSLRDFYAILRELKNILAVDLENDDEKIHVRFKNSLPPMVEKSELTA